MRPTLNCTCSKHGRARLHANASLHVQHSRMQAQQGRVHAQHGAVQPRLSRLSVNRGCGCDCPVPASLKAWQERPFQRTACCTWVRARGVHLLCFPVQVCHRLGVPALIRPPSGLSWLLSPFIWARALPRLHISTGHCAADCWLQRPVKIRRDAVHE